METALARVLVVISLELGGGEQVEIRVREGDDPKKVATAFAEKHGAKFMAATATDDTPEVREALIANLAAKVKHHMDKASKKRRQRRESKRGAQASAEEAMREEDAAQRAKKRLPQSVASRHASARRASGLLPRGAKKVKTPSPSRAQKESFYNKLKSHYEKEAGRLVRPQTTAHSSPALKSSATPKRTASRQPKTKNAAKKKKKKKKKNRKAKSKRTKGKVGEVFARLYSHAFVRQEKLHKLQQEAARADRELAMRTVADGKSVGGDDGAASPQAHSRLYNQGLLSMMRNDNLHAKRLNEMEMSDLTECTFRPMISNRAKALNRKEGWALGKGVDRITVANLERIRRANEARDSKECVFKPTISTRSKELAEEKSMRASFGASNPVLGARASIHNELYLDAERRRLKVEARESALEKELAVISSAPDIGLNAHRPPKEATQRAFTDRLVNEGFRREARLDEQRLRELSYDDKTGQKMFQPKVGRGPSYQHRFAEHEIHENLYASRTEFDDIKDVLLRREAGKRAKERSKALKVSESSAEILRGTLDRKCSEVFSVLCALVRARSPELDDENDDDSLPWDAFNVPGDEEQLIEVCCELPEVIQAVALDVLYPNLGQRISRGVFSSALFDVVWNRKGPQDGLIPSVADLLRVGLGSGDTGPHSRARSREADVAAALDHEAKYSFKPTVDKVSEELVRNRRDVSEGDFEHRLLLKSKVVEDQLARERDLKIQKELEECTFKPKLCFKSISYANERGDERPVDRPTHATTQQRIDVWEARQREMRVLEAKRIERGIEEAIANKFVHPEYASKMYSTAQSHYRYRDSS